MRLMSVERQSQAAHTPARRQAGFLSQRTWGVLAVLVALMLIPYWMAKKTNAKAAAKLSVAQDKAPPTVAPTQSAAATSTIVASGSTPNPDRFGLSFGHGDLQGKSGLMVSTCAGAPLDMGNPDKNQCNPIQGDSACRTALPVLCVLKDGSTAESAGLVNATTAAAATKTEGIEKPSDASLNLCTGWVSGTLGATAPVAGFVIGSLAQANARCAAELGSGWRMAEVRDAASSGSSSWGLVGKRGQGLASQQTRHWVHINDQKANCWDTQTQ